VLIRTGKQGRGARFLYQVRPKTDLFLSFTLSCYDGPWSDVGTNDGPQMYEYSSTLMTRCDEYSSGVLACPRLSVPQLRASASPRLASAARDSRTPDVGSFVRRGVDSRLHFFCSLSCLELVSCQASDSARAPSCIHVLPGRAGWSVFFGRPNTNRPHRPEMRANIPQHAGRRRDRPRTDATDRRLKLKT
jgi:hypothetical protein